jgi:rhodanese-related sulfurtransferase
MQLAVKKYKRFLFRTYMRNLMLLLFVFNVFSNYAQDSISELLKIYNSGSIPYVSVQELAMPKTTAILLDARERSEYEVSHLQNAIHVGHDNFDIEVVTEKITDTSAIIVVYCSLGVRSEDIAEQLKTAGYTNIYNLFGGIFEWKNNGFTVYNNQDKPTENVHAFSKEWSKWLLKGNKIYD